MAFQSAFVATVTQDNFGTARSETDEVCDNGLLVRKLEDFNSYPWSFALLVTQSFSGESKPLESIYMTLHSSPKTSLAT